MKRTSDNLVFLDSVEQEQIITDFQLRINKQRLLWKNTFASISLLLAVGVLYVYLADVGWYPQLLSRSTYVQTPSLATSRYLTVVFILSLLCTSVTTFFQSSPLNSTLLIVAFNLIMSSTLVILSPSRSVVLLCPTGYQVLCSVAMYVLSGIDQDLEKLKRTQYKFKKV